MTNQLFRDYLDGKIPVRTSEQLRRAAFMQAGARVVASIAAMGFAFGAIARQQEINAAHARMIALCSYVPSRAYPPRPPRHLDPDPRVAALAAKAARGKGPPSSVSWRGRERTPKFRSQ